MGIGDTIKSVVNTLKQNVRYECRDCDYEAERKFFDENGDELVCPDCGSTRVSYDD
jgi:DNA-directed RNA polymerase subunit RPC12/RpoP